MVSLTSGTIIILTSHEASDMKVKKNQYDYSQIAQEINLSIIILFGMNTPIQVNQVLHINMKTTEEIMHFLYNIAKMQAKIIHNATINIDLSINLTALILCITCTAFQ